MSFEQLKLENQLCFPLYVASRLIIRKYQPYLDVLGVTYPQYLVLMVLWEEDQQPVNDIAKKLILNTNTITPLLKRLEILKVISRDISLVDKRKVVIKLTEKGRNMESLAADIPLQLGQSLTCGDLDLDTIVDLKYKLHKFIDSLEL